MKRLICILLAVLLLSGCSFMGERMKEPVTFYYVRENYRKDMEPVIASEVREASGHRDDLSYLLALYSMGPTNDELTSLLPRNTSIALTEYTDDSITLQLSEGAAMMSDADFTLTCACISLTCMELSDIELVTLVCEDRTMPIRKDQLMQYNNLSPTSQEDTN